MSTAIPSTECNSISSFPSIGFGTDLLGLKKYYDRVVSDLKKAETLGQVDTVLQELHEVYLECSEEGWDGYDAQSISEAAYVEVRKFIEYLPLISSIPVPEIIPEPGGEIGLEWSRGTRQVFIASFAGNNEIIYAGLFGTNKTHGTEYFGDSIPSKIMDNLKILSF